MTTSRHNPDEPGPICQRAGECKSLKLLGWCGICGQSFQREVRQHNDDVAVLDAAPARIIDAVSTAVFSDESPAAEIEIEKCLISCSVNEQTFTIGFGSAHLKMSIEMAEALHELLSFYFDATKDGAERIHAADIDAVAQAPEVQG